MISGEKKSHITEEAEIEKTRIDWIDIGKGICILFVIISHLSIIPNRLRCFFIPWFLIGFYMLSGYVYKNNKNFMQLIIKKAKTLLIPWFFFSIIDIIQLVLFGKDSIPIYMRILYAIIQIKGLHETIWFLPSLFISFIPFYFFNRNGITKKNVLIQFVLCTLSVLYGMYINPNFIPWKSAALPWHMNICFIASFFMTIGYWLKEDKKVIKLINKIPVFCIPIFIIIYFIFTNIIGKYGLTDYATKNILLYCCFFRVIYFIKYFYKN